MCMIILILYVQTQIASYIPQLDHARLYRLQSSFIFEINNDKGKHRDITDRKHGYVYATLHS